MTPKKSTKKTGSPWPLLGVDTMEKEKNEEEERQKRIRDGAETRKKRRIDKAAEKKRMEEEEAATKREEEEEAARKREEEEAEAKRQEEVSMRKRWRRKGRKGRINGRRRCLSYTITKRGSHM